MYTDGDYSNCCDGKPLNVFCMNVYMHIPVLFTCCVNCIFVGLINFAIASAH